MREWLLDKAFGALLFVATFTVVLAVELAIILPTILEPMARAGWSP